MPLYEYKCQQCSTHFERIEKAFGLPDFDAVLEREFRAMKKVSIDYAVMEKADSVYAIPLDCRWLDMGSFAALADLIKSDANDNIVVAGTSELLNCKNNIVVTEDKDHLIAAIGLENIVVAHTPDATLVCDLSQTERLKELLEMIEQRGHTRFL